MRPIKFRFYDFKKEKMITQCDTDRLDLVLEQCEITPKCSYPMQYTGLKDKIGTEIYEGDILSDDTQNYLVVFYEGAFILEGYSRDVFLQHLCDLKIIGNKYMNPELETY